MTCLTKRGHLERLNKARLKFWNALDECQFHFKREEFLDVIDIGKKNIKASWFDKGFCCNKKGAMMVIDLLDKFHRDVCRDIEKFSKELDEDLGINSSEVH